MRYIELKIEVNKDDLEMLEAELMDAGFVELVIDDPADAVDIIEHKEWYKYDYIDEEVKQNLERNPIVTLYFDEDEKEIDRAKAVAKRFDTKISESIQDDQDWLYKWQEYFKPTKVSDRIVVKPTWEKYEAKEDELVVEIDPGMAFGTGTHETTSMCIEALEKYLGAEQTVLDVGCGSGILSIAAARLGAKAALGIEIDSDAVEIAKCNVDLNGLSSQIRIQYGDLTKGVDYKADIVVANLMADLVIMLSADVSKHLKPNGIYISSGILNEKEEIVSVAIRNAGFEIIEVLHKNDWCAIVARRK